MPELKFSIVRLYYPKISVTANSDHDPNEDITSVSFDTGIVLRYNRTEKKIHLNYYFKTEEPNDSNLPYSIDMHHYSIYKLEPDFAGLPEELRQEVLLDMANAAVGSLREVIAATTARAPWGSYFIPITDMDMVAESMYQSYLLGESKKKKRAPTKKIAPKPKIS